MKYIGFNFQFVFYIFVVGEQTAEINKPAQKILSPWKFERQSGSVFVEHIVNSGRMDVFS